MRFYVVCGACLLGTWSLFAQGKPEAKVGDFLNVGACMVRPQPSSESGRVGTAGHGPQKGTVIDVTTESSELKWLKIQVTASDDGGNTIEVWEETAKGPRVYNESIPFVAWVEMPETANHRCYEIDTAAAMEAQQNAEADALSSLKTEHRFRIGPLQKSRLLAKLTEQYKAEGYTGQRLATKLKGAKLGINAMAANSFTVELKTGGKLITTQSGRKQVYDYRLAGQIVEVLAKESGEYRRFGKLNSAKTVLEILDPVNGTETAVILQK